MLGRIVLLLALLPAGGAFELADSRSRLTAGPLRARRLEAIPKPALVAASSGGPPSELVAASWIAGLAIASEVVQASTDLTLTSTLTLTIPLP